MSTNTNEFKVLTPEEFAALSADDKIAYLTAQLADKEAKLAAKEADKPKRQRKLTPEEEAKRAEREAHEKVELAAEGTPTRYIQDRPRISQIDAAPKLLRMLKWNDVAPIILDLAEKASAVSGRTVMELLDEATHRNPVAKKEGEPTAEEPKAEGGETKTEESKEEPKVNDETKKGDEQPADEPAKGKGAKAGKAQREKATA